MLIYKRSLNFPQTKIHQWWDGALCPKIWKSKIMESSYRCEEGAETFTGASHEIFTEQKIQATLLDWETVRRLI